MSVFLGHLSSTEDGRAEDTATDFCLGMEILRSMGLKCFGKGLKFLRNREFCSYLSIISYSFSFILLHVCQYYL